jgi:uncharacterized protein YegP (UPF0339 family)
MKNPYFKIFKSIANGQYYYRLRAANGEIVLSGEGYTSKQSCLEGIAAVSGNAADMTRYHRHNDYMNYTFVLKAANGEIIGRSESYITPAGRDAGICAVKRSAGLAAVEDLSR